MCSTNQAATAYLFTPSTTETNATFATRICSELDALVQANSLISSAQVVQGVNDTTWFDLPECFWSSTTSVSTLRLANVIVSGNVTLADPFKRLTSSITTLSLTNCILVNPESSNYVPAFEVLGQQLPKIAQLEIVSTPLNGAELPSMLPKMITSLVITGSGLSGSIPGNLLGNLLQPSYLTIMLSDNNLSGSIPSTLVSNWVSAQSVNTFILDLDFNQLTGSLPAAFLKHLSDVSSSISTINIFLNSNQLSGSVPDDFLPVCRVSRAIVNISSNALSGSISSFGTAFVSQFPTAFTLYASHNNFTGDVPAWYGELQPSNFGLNSLALDFSHNQLSSIPSYGVVPNATYMPRLSFTMDLSYNQLSGDFPGFQFGAASNVITLDLSNNLFSNNGLSLSSLIDPSSRSFTLTNLALNMNNNKLTGALLLSGGLTDAQKVILARGGLSLNVSNNDLTSFQIDDLWGASITSLDISKNSRLSSGTFPQGLTNRTAIVKTLMVAGTALGGSFPDFGVQMPYALANIDFSDNAAMAFCSASRANWTATLTSCNLQQTNANKCADYYPSQCVVSASNETPDTPVAPTAPTPRLAPTPIGNASSLTVSVLLIAVAVAVAMVM